MFRCFREAVRPASEVGHLVAVQVDLLEELVEDLQRVLARADATSISASSSPVKSNEVSETLASGIGEASWGSVPFDILRLITCEGTGMTTVT